MENERDPQGRAIQNRYFGWLNELIKEDCRKNAFEVSVMFDNLDSDFNVSSCIRSALAFGAKEFFYYGKRKIDRRGAVSAYHYIDVNYIGIDDVIKLKEKYKLIALDNNFPGFIDIRTFQWPINSLIIIGNENSGINDSIREMADYHIEIPMFGAPRSINAAQACSIALYSYVTQVTK